MLRVSIFFSPLSRVTETEKRKSRGQTRENTKMPRGMRWNLLATIHTWRIFSTPSHFFSVFLSLSLRPFRQITDFRRCQVLRFMYIQPTAIVCAQLCEGISPGSGVFTEGYNFAAVYNLQPKGAYAYPQFVRFASGVFVNRHRYRSTAPHRRIHSDSQAQTEQRKSYLNILTVSGIALLRKKNGGTVCPVGKRKNCATLNASCCWQRIIIGNLYFNE